MFLREKSVVNASCIKEMHDVLEYSIESCSSYVHEFAMNKQEYMSDSFLKKMMDEQKLLEPAQPAQPAEPTQPVEPVLTMATTTTEPVDLPVEPVEPVATMTTELVDLPVAAAASAAPVEPVEPVEPAEQPVEPVEPVYTISKEQWDFLVKLQKSGNCNMVLAAPHLQKKFSLSEQIARELHMEYMVHYKELEQHFKTSSPSSCASSSASSQESESEAEDKADKTDSEAPSEAPAETKDKKSFKDLTYEEVHVIFSKMAEKIGADATNVMIREYFSKYKLFNMQGRTMNTVEKFWEAYVTNGNTGLLNMFKPEKSVKRTREEAKEPKEPKGQLSFHASYQKLLQSHEDLTKRLETAVESLEKCKKCRCE